MRATTLIAIVGTLVMIAGMLAFVQTLPEIQRYLKMKSM